MKKKKIILAIIIILLVVNLPVINTEILRKVDAGHFRYSNNDASFTSIQYLDIFSPWIDEWTVWSFISSTRPAARNMEVFRLYKINPLCFWRWRYYILVSRKFRYKSWKEIEPNRVPFVPDNKWQHF